jgi:hypothetical protein
MGEQIMSDATENEKQVQEQALSISELATVVMVVDVDSFEKAGDLKKTANSARKKIVEWFKPLKQDAKKAHTTVCDREKEYLNPIDNGIRHIQTQMDDFATEQERIRQAAERKVREKAETEARKERERLARAAEKAAEKGNEEKAALLKEQAAEVVATPVFVAPTVEKTVRTATATISQQKKTVVQVTDLKALLGFIATQQFSPIEAVEIKQSVLEKWVKNNQVKNGSVPGIVISERIVSTTR